MASALDRPEPEAEAVGRRRALGLLLSTLLVTLTAMAALAAGAQKAPVALHLRFRLLARGVSALSVSGPYVGFTQTTSTRQRTRERFVLLDDRTGKRIVTPPNCDCGVVGVPWVAFDCASAIKRFQLYNIQTRKWQRFACDASCRQVYYLIDITAVGARWLALSVAPHQPCGDGVHYSCGPTTNIFYNIATGKPRSPRMDRTTIVDLNSATLTRPICRPLQLPAAEESLFPPALAF